VSKFLYIIKLLFFLLFAHAAMAQEDTLTSTLQFKTSHLIIDSVLQRKKSLLPDSLTTKPFKPNPITVVWKGAILPGYGQILNKKYWKVPIVYGGFLGCAYAIAWNSSRYTSYKTAYRDILLYSSDAEFKSIIDKDPSKASFVQILPKGYTVESIGGISTYSNSLRSAQDNFRRYRDLSVISTVAFYALTLVDAFVDAQLYDFDISPDLSLRVQPTLMQSTNGLQNMLGMQCSFSFR
jgi:hypothetical protein